MVLRRPETVGRFHKKQTQIQLNQLCKHARIARPLASRRGGKVGTHVSASPPMLGFSPRLCFSTHALAGSPSSLAPGRSQGNLKANRRHDATPPPRLLTYSPLLCGSLHAIFHPRLHLPAEMISAALTPSVGC